MQYNKLILDFDGVVCDSNGFKGANILSAAKRFAAEDTALAFQHYFTSNNGIPRQVKINNFFKDEATAKGILAEYDRLNANLVDAPLVTGVEEFLEKNKGLEIFILSGGIEKEIVAYLQKHAMQHYFSGIYCGPQTKEENLLNFNLSGPDILYIGDAWHDYEIAKQFSLQFIFLYGYTQFAQWNQDDCMPGITKCKDFSEINKLF